MPSDLWGAMSGSRVEGGGRLSVRASMPFLGSLFQQASEAKENGAGCSCGFPHDGISISHLLTILAGSG